MHTVGQAPQECHPELEEVLYRLRKMCMCVKGGWVENRWVGGGERADKYGEGLGLTTGTAANWKLMVTGDSRFVLITSPPTTI